MRVTPKLFLSLAVIFFMLTEDGWLYGSVLYLDMHEAAEGTNRFRTSDSDRLKAFRRKASIGSICWSPYSNHIVVNSREYGDHNDGRNDSSP